MGGGALCWRIFLPTTYFIIHDKANFLNAQFLLESHFKTNKMLHHSLKSYLVVTVVGVLSVRLCSSLGQTALNAELYYVR